MAGVGSAFKLDPPTEFHGGTYLGQTQENVIIPSNIVEEHSVSWRELFQDDRGSSTYDPESVNNAVNHRTAVETKRQQEEEAAKERAKEEKGRKKGKKEEKRGKKGWWK